MIVLIPDLCPICTLILSLFAFLLHRSFLCASIEGSGGTLRNTCLPEPLKLLYAGVPESNKRTYFKSIIKFYLDQPSQSYSLVKVMILSASIFEHTRICIKSQFQHSNEAI